MVYFLLLLFSGLVVSDSFVTPWTCQDPLSMGFPRQEYWSRLPFPSPIYVGIHINVSILSSYLKIKKCLHFEIQWFQKKMKDIYINEHIL